MTGISVGTAALIAGGLSAGATVYSTYQSRQAAQQQEKARRAQKRIAEQKQQRQRRAAIREAQIKRAQVENTAAQTGTQFSSGAQGAGASISSQLADNLSFLDSTQRAADVSANASNAAANAQTNAATAQGAADLFAAGSNYFGSQPDQSANLSTIFD